MDTNVVTVGAEAPAKLDGTQVVSGDYKVTVERGVNRGEVSRQWFSRPDDEKYLTLSELRDFVADRKQNCWTTTSTSSAIAVRAMRDDAMALELRLPDGRILAPTHWSFGQLCQQIGAPAGYMRNLPAPVAAGPIRHGLLTHRAEEVKVFARDIGEDSNGIITEMRALTSPAYGRIYDLELVEQVMKIAGNGNGDTHWKIPGQLDWATMRYNPFVSPTKDSTTLYASDRDVWLFLVDDTRPIEVGKLADGSPDLMFRGFYAWNSEVGSKSMGVATMLLRAVCMNRNLWGVEEFNELNIRHTLKAPERFALEAGPALERFSEASDVNIVRGIRNAKGRVVAQNDDERKAFLKNLDFSKKATDNILQAVFEEEGHPAESVYDFVNGITAYARDIPHTDTRVDMEKLAGKLLSKAAA